MAHNRRQTNQAAQTGGNVAGRSFASLFGQGGKGGFGGMSGPLLFAYLIAQGKMLENQRLRKNPDDALGNTGLALLGPSFKQSSTAIKENPFTGLIGTAFGPAAPFLFSDKAKQKKPEFSFLFGG